MFVKLFYSKPKHQVVRVEVQGDHGYRPPENAVREAVDQWLASLDLPSEENVQYSLEIGGWKRIGGANGVKAFQVMDEPLDNIVELRVRVSEMNDFLWRCLLVCPSTLLAWDVMAWSHKYSFRFLQALNEHKEAKRGECLDAPITAPSRRDRRLMTKNRCYDPDTVVSRLMRGKTLLPFCHQLWLDYRQEPIPVDEIFNRVERITGSKITKDIGSGFLEALLVKGIVEIRRGEANFLYATEALEERALDRIEEIRQAEIEQLIARSSSLIKHRTAAEKELGRLCEKVCKQKENIQRMEMEETEIRTEIDKLSSESIGSFSNNN